VFNPWAGLAGLPREIWALGAATLVNRMGTMALPFLLLYLTEELHHPAASAASVLAAYGAASLLGAPLGGRLCDHVGALRVMQWSLVASGLLLFVLPLARTLPAVLAVVVVWSLVGEAVRPASMTMLAELAEGEQRKPAIAMNRLAINLGMSVGPVVGGVLATVSYPALFVVDGVTSILAAVVLALTLKARPGAAHAAHPHGHARHELRGVLRDGPVMAFLVATVLLGGVFFQHLGALPLFAVRDLGLSKPEFGLLSAVNTTLIVFLEVWVNTSTAHWSHRLSLVSGSLLCAVGFGVMGLAGGFWGLAACVVVWTVGEMILFPSMGNYMADAAPPARRGEYMGAYTMAFGLSFAIAPWAGTVLMETHGAMVMWPAVGALGLLATAIMYHAAGLVRHREPAAAPS
jgi:MFS family permease